MDFTETEVVEIRLRHGKCAYSGRNDINTEYLFIVSLKTTKKERGKKKTIRRLPGVGRGTFRRAVFPYSFCATRSIHTYYGKSKQ